MAARKYSQQVKLVRLGKRQDRKLMNSQEALAQFWYDTVEVAE